MNTYTDSKGGTWFQYTENTGKGNWSQGNSMNYPMNYPMNYENNKGTYNNTQFKGKGKNTDTQFKGKGKNNDIQIKGKGKGNENEPDKNLNNLQLVDNTNSDNLTDCPSCNSHLECIKIWENILKDLVRNPMYVIRNKIKNNEIICSKTKKHSAKDITRILDIIESAIINNESVADMYNQGYHFYKYNITSIKNKCKHGDKCIAWLLGGKDSCMFLHELDPIDITINDLLSRFRLTCSNKNKCPRACVGSCTFNHTEDDIEKMKEFCSKIKHVFGQKTNKDNYELIVKSFNEIQELTDYDEYEPDQA